MACHLSKLFRTVRSPSVIVYVFPEAKITQRFFASQVFFIADVSFASQLLFIANVKLCTDIVGL